MADWKQAIADAFLSKKAQGSLSGANQKAKEDAEAKQAAKDAEEEAARNKAKAKVKEITFKKGGSIDGAARKGKTRGRIV